jgi:hypothetical protein
VGKSVSTGAVGASVPSVDGVIAGATDAFLEVVGIGARGAVTTVAFLELPATGALGVVTLMVDVFPMAITESPSQETATKKAQKTRMLDDDTRDFIESVLCCWFCWRKQAQTYSLKTFLLRQG